ncbi:hypothetical protein D3C76_1463450 [compost metagenome]
MHAYHRHQVGVPGLVEVVEEWPVLVVVGIQVLLRQLQVGLDEVVEHLDVQVDAFLGQGRFDEFEDFRVRHRRGTDDQVFGGLGAEGDESGEGGKGLFHGGYLRGVGVNGG